MSLNDIFNLAIRMPHSPKHARSGTSQKHSSGLISTSVSWLSFSTSRSNVASHLPILAIFLDATTIPTSVLCGVKRGIRSFNEQGPVIVVVAGLGNSDAYADRQLSILEA